MTPKNMNLKKTIIAIWNLLNRVEKKDAKFYIGWSMVATFLEMLSLGMILPLLYAFTSTTPITDSRVLGYFLNSPLIQNLNLLYILVLLIVIYSIKNIFLLFLVYYQAKFVFGIEKSMSNRIYKIYLTQPYPFFLKNNSSELIRNVMRESSQFAHNALSPLCLLVTEFFIAIGVISLLIIVNPIGAICSLILFGCIGYIFYTFAHKKISKWGKEHQFHEGKRLQNLQEGFGSIKEVLIGSLQGKFTAQYASHMDASATAGINQQSVQSAPRLFIEIFAVIVLAVTVSLFNESEPAMLLPIIGLYAAAAFRLMPSVNRIINALQSLRYSESSVHLLASELSRIDSSISSGHSQKVNFNKSIELKGLTFQYGPQSKILFKDANFFIKKGDVVFVTGPSGAGKTTLVDIICGLQKPTSGKLLVDGLDVDSCIAEWQKHIAYVPQTTFLLDGTIKENIVFGDVAQIDYKRLEEVCSVSGVDEFIETLSAGLETSVGESGSNLSGGQRQRIGIARALYRGGALLVLDEATNALDSKLESLVAHNILAYTANITKIWITHNSIALPNAKFLLVGMDGVREL